MLKNNEFLEFLKKMKFCNKLFDYFKIDISYFSKLNLSMNTSLQA